MKWTLLVLVIFCSGGNALGQFRMVSGVVLDGNDVSLLEGVRVHSGTGTDTVLTDEDGRFSLQVPVSGASLVFETPGYGTVERKLLPRQQFMPVFLYPAYAGPGAKQAPDGPPVAGLSVLHRYQVPVSIKAHQDETYEQVVENPFERASRFPFSAFMLNADDASYCNVRRFLMTKQLPPKEAVRIEEMVNHLPLAYAVDSVNPAPLTLETELSTCPLASRALVITYGLSGPAGAPRYRDPQ